MRVIIFALLACFCLTAKAQLSQQASFLKNSKWPSESSGATIIRVSWENPSSSNAQQRQWVREVIENTWERYSNIDFVGWGAANSSTDGIRIVINDYGHPHTKGLGTSLDGTKDGMLLNFEFLGAFECPFDTKDCITWIAVHEFGHALGFAHEHNRSDCLCNENPQGTNGDFYLTPCDPKSVMNYCNPDYANLGVLSDLDVQGLQKVYGSPGNLRSIVELNEIRFVPVAQSSSLLSRNRTIENHIEGAANFAIKRYTYEGEDVPTPAVDNLPYGDYIIRYFHPDDEAKTEDLKSMLRNKGVSGAITVESMLPRMSRTYPNYIEIWTK